VNTRLLQFVDDQLRDHGRSRLFGVVVGIVTNNNDPDRLGRVKVKFPWLSAGDESAWARLAVPMAGNARGLCFLPEIDDEVLVMFERGDVRFPYVIGALWNGKERPPVDNADGKNNLRVIKSRSGHVIRFNDEVGKETLEIVDASGGNRVVIDTANKTITVTSGQNIVLSAPEGAIKLAARRIEIEAVAEAGIKAGKGMTVAASGTLNVSGSTVNIN
jgi:uncharacterized protein involved in type VI secretion and phage assembly